MTFHHNDFAIVARALHGLVFRKIKQRLRKSVGNIADLPPL